MSIIERYSPLNLAYKVIIVTNASSPVGVIVSNTLLKANALVLGTDPHPKDHSLSASTYSHFQFYQTALTDGSAVKEIIADAKRKFKADHIDGLVNLMSAKDDADTRTVHRELATACATEMQAALDGGAIVNTIIEVPGGGVSDAKAADQLVEATKSVSQALSAKVRCNGLAPAEDGKGKASQQYENAKEHFKFLFQRLENQQGQQKTIPAETQEVFDFSNTVLFLASGMSEGLNGTVIDAHGRIVKE